MNDHALAAAAGDKATTMATVGRIDPAQVPTMTGILLAHWTQMHAMLGHVMAEHTAAQDAALATIAAYQEALAESHALLAVSRAAVVAAQQQQQQMEATLAAARRDFFRLRLD